MARWRGRRARAEEEESGHLSLALEGERRPAEGGALEEGSGAGVASLLPPPHGCPAIDRAAQLEAVEDDPRRAAGAEIGKAQRAARGEVGLSGRNTVSFDPASTLVRPSMRIIVGPRRERYGRPVRHDDVIIVPEFFCEEDDWETRVEGALPILP
mmetsp:Transcript_140730/g.448877  ORF Transcript_140730/g.448877 Transcript_140730/m.448877 type:complete len:155 (-) Transcript_140730:48-512(-)